jgi:pimeloyl-ACP methyl ester carboxylesterase
MVLNLKRVATFQAILLMLGVADLSAGPRQNSLRRFEPSACLITIPSSLTVDCGVLVVPENRIKDNGRTVSLPVAIVRTKSTSPASDPIVYVTGGPAFNEIEPFSMEFVASLPFAANRDFIFYNQRGVGFSEPRLGCPEFDDVRTTAFPRDPTPEQYFAAVAACRDRLEGEGIELDAYNSAEDAADLRDLRIALGYPEWNIFTLSAGGIIPLTLMHLYPDGIRSVILDSAAGTIYTWRGPDAVGAMNRNLEMIFAGCLANAGCNAAYPNLRERFYNRVHTLRVQPVTVSSPVAGGSTVQFTIDGDHLLNDIAQCTDPGCATILPGLMDLAAKGDIAGVYDAFLGGGELTPPDPVDAFLSEGKSGVYHCHDAIAFEPNSELVQAAHELPEFRVSLLTLRFIYVPTSTKEACKVWRVGRAKSDQHEPVTSSIPTLVLAGKWDNIVSPLHSQELARTLSNSFFFEFPGVGHVTLFWGDCPNQIAAEFIAAPTAAADSSCILNMADPDFTPPFLGTPANSTARHRDALRHRSLLPYKH